MKRRGLFLLDQKDKWDILEKMFSIPIEKRMEWLAIELEKKRVTYLGSTDKSAPELATEFIKRGVKAKSIVGGKSKKCN